MKEGDEMSDSRQKEKRALILSNGNPPGPALLEQERRKAHLLICCDGAGDYAFRQGVRADFLVGDFDSLQGGRGEDLAAQLGARCLRFPQKKDQSDTQLAAELAMEEGCDHVTFLGGLGGRFDHALANAQLLILCEKRGVEAVLLDEQNEIYATCSYRHVDGQPGDYLSVIPMGEGVCVRRTAGLAYPMADRELILGDSYSLSNQFAEKCAYVELSRGWALLMRSRDAL